jgi:hypothetical protein
MKGYFSSKRSHPWHRIFKDIDRYWPKKQEEELESVLLQIRTAVFGAFDVLSIAVGSSFSTEEILEVFAKADNWNDARRKVRRRCSDAIREMIMKGQTRYLQSSALRRDGFAYHVSTLEEKKWQTFVDAQPKIKRNKLDLTQLEKSEIGGQFLREQGVTELKISKDDERVPLILEAYEHFLVEYEVDRDSRIPIPTDTEQITLNGTPIEEAEEPTKKVPKRDSADDDSVQAELTDFLPPEKEKKKPVSKRKKKTSKKTRKSKKSQVKRKKESGGKSK